jgi:hypothetical protein
MATMNKRFVLASRPTGEPTPQNFRLEDVPLPTLKDGEVLVRHHYLSLDPYMRGRMSDAASYATPVQIDPERPALPISHPSFYSAYLAKLLGTYSTLGMAEDTWALNEGVIDEQAFLDQSYSILAEREAKGRSLCGFFATHGEIVPRARAKSIGADLRLLTSGERREAQSAIIIAVNALSTREPQAPGPAGGACCFNYCVSVPQHPLPVIPAEAQRLPALAPRNDSRF